MQDNEVKRIKAEKLKEMKKSVGRKEVAKIEIEANDANFIKDVVERSETVPVVADFWADWCMPCLELSPTLEKVAKKYNGKFVLAKINVDNSPAASTKYMVSAIPAVKMFKKGKIVGEFLGALTEQEVELWLNKNL